LVFLIKILRKPGFWGEREGLKAPGEGKGARFSYVKI